jgi:hypothetical protein
LTRTANPTRTRYEKIGFEFYIIGFGSKSGQHDSDPIVFFFFFYKKKRRAKIAEVQNSNRKVRNCETQTPRTANPSRLAHCPVARTPTIRPFPVFPLSRPNFSLPPLLRSYNSYPPPYSRIPATPPITERPTTPQPVCFQFYFLD